MIHTQDQDFTLLCGDVLDELAGLPDESVHCCITSPPYWGLRDYGTGLWDGGDADCDHLRSNRYSASTTLNAKVTDGASEAKRTPYGDICGKCGARRVDQQLGLEPTPELYVARMVEVFREVRRVLRADGTCFVNLGDSYASAWACGRRNVVGNGSMENGKRDGRPNRLVGGLKEKDLVGIPWMVAFALRADGWYLRSDIIWAKPNPMPESVTDRPTKAHEYVFLLTRSPRYYYDAEAVREPHQMGPNSHNWGTKGQPQGRGDAPDGVYRPFAIAAGGRQYHPAGRNVRSVWDIATQPYPEAHFATYPEELVRRCVLAGSSERGCCPVCGAPWERETNVVRGGPSTADERFAAGSRPYHQSHRGGTTGKVAGSDTRGMPSRSSQTLGWRPGCTCTRPLDGFEVQRGANVPIHDPISCTILDPFLGSGTTAYVARKHGRRSIGIELNVQYADLAARRMQQQSLLV